MPSSRGNAKSISNLSPIATHSLYLEFVKLLAYSRTSIAGFDFLQVSRPTISGIVSAMPIASKVFLAA